MRIIMIISLPFMIVFTHIVPLYIILQHHTDFYTNFQIYEPNNSINNFSEGFVLEGQDSGYCPLHSYDIRCIYICDSSTTS